MIDLPDDVSYLKPLFLAAERHLDAESVVLLPEPEPGCSLLADDAAVGSWNATTLINNSILAGMLHVDSLRRLAVMLGHLDPVTPWTVLRGALEDFSTALWLVSGNGRRERQHRALSLWAQDFRNLEQYEQDTGFEPIQNQKTGKQRFDEIVLLASQMGLPRPVKPKIEEVVMAAAVQAGLNDVETRALWRVASGFAHGRQWPNLRTLEARDVKALRSGYSVGLVLGDEQFKKMAESVLAVLSRAEDLYHARRVAQQQLAWTGATQQKADILKRILNQSIASPTGRHFERSIEGEKAMSTIGATTAMDTAGMSAEAWSEPA